MKQKLISLITAITMVMSLISGFTVTTASAEDITTIYGVADLEAFRDSVNGGNTYEGKTVTLNANLDLSGKNWTPIGDSSSHVFKGTFDGGFHTIYNLTINTTDRYCGLFGKLQNAEIKNLGIENASITSSDTDAAVLAGNAQGGTISRCYVAGTVKGSGAVSGILGSTHSSSYTTEVDNCYARVAIVRNGSRTTKDLAGISGWNEATSVKITNCYCACTGEIRPIAGWSDGSAVSNSQFENTYFDKTLSPDFSESAGRADLGKTSDELKTQSTYTGWDFASVWTISSDKNGGYPYLQGFTPGLGGAPGSVSVTVTDSENAAVTNAQVEIAPKDSGDKITLSHQGNGVYSAAVTTSDTEYDVYVNGEKKGTVTQNGTAAAVQSITVTGNSKPPIFENGDGTEANPYIIPDIATLTAFRDSVNGGETYEGKFIKLTADIDLSSVCGTDIGGAEVSWTPIGDSSHNFQGTFDGGNHKITGLYINAPSNDYQGLFGCIGDGMVKNLGVHGTVTGKNRVGGIVGYNGTVQNCYNTGTVTGTGNNVGGIVGYNGTVQNCYNTGTISSTGDNVGGLVGWNTGKAVQNCYNTGAVSGGSNVGGVVGYTWNDITKCYSVCTVTGAGSNVGGVVGYKNGGNPLTSCYYDNTVNTTSNATTGVTGMATADFATDTNFSGWEFGSVWKMSTALGRPILTAIPEPEPHSHDMSVECGNDNAIGFDHALTSENGKLCIDGEPVEPEFVSGAISSIELPKGNYYLKEDTTIPSVEYMLYRINVAEEVNLCLNGKTLNTGKNYIYINSGGAINLCDCGEGGTITSVYSRTSRVATIENFGSFSIYGGKVENAADKDFGAALAIYGTSPVKIYGGELVSANDNAIGMSGSRKELHILCEPKIKGAEDKAELYLSNLNTQTIMIDVPFTLDKPLRVDANYARLFTSGWKTHMSDKAFSDYFVSVRKGKFINENASGELEVYDYKITEQPSSANNYTITANGAPDYAPIGYQWYSSDNDEAVSGQTAKQFTGNADGTYVCKVTYADGTVLTSDVVDYTAPKPPHKHPVCGAGCAHEGAHTAQEWIPLTYDSENDKLIAGDTSFEPSSSGFTLDAGNYYLAEDITLPDEFGYDGHININKATNLCLNGHTLNGYVNASGYEANFSLCDCSENKAGKIEYSGTSSHGYHAAVAVGGDWRLQAGDAAFTMYGGSVIGKGENTGLSVNTTKAAALLGGSVKGGNNAEACDIIVSASFAWQQGKYLPYTPLAVGYAIPSGTRIGAYWGYDRSQYPDPPVVKGAEGYTLTNTDLANVTVTAKNEDHSSLKFTTKLENNQIVIMEEPKPTATPTVNPTATPTVKPTATPTVNPTATPTANPTATPTVNPTATPTANPTATPTANPTATPTVNPTATPTVNPTATPAASPSATPAPTPTANPNHNVVVDVKPNTPQVTVDGLDEVLNEADPTASKVTITMTIESKSEDSSNDEHNAIKLIGGDSENIDYLDISLIKTVDNEESAITETSKTIKIVIPFDKTGKNNIKVYRYHGGSAELLSDNAENDEYYVVGDGVITVYANKFSTYAIGYDTETSDPTATPTVTPTAAPTAKPSHKGGLISSVRTTPKPTATPKATDSPTAAPTVNPTAAPSDGTKTHKAYIVGYERKFNPDGNITRAETAAMLARLDDSFDENESYTTTFADVDSALWYYRTVGFAESQNIITGYEDGTFKPEGSITRAEFASMIAKFAELDIENTYTPFEDVNGHWAADKIAACYEAEYIHGYEGNIFRPDEFITRAEAVFIINRMLGRDDLENIENPFTDVSQTHWAYTDIMEAAVTHNSEDN